MSIYYVETMSIYTLSHTVYIYYNIKYMMIATKIHCLVSIYIPHKYTKAVITPVQCYIYG